MHAAFNLEREYMNNAPALKAALFDLDGTLVDSEMLHHQNAIATCKEYGYDYGMDDFFRFHGQSMQSIFRQLKPQFTNQNISFDEFLKKNIDLFEQNINKDHIFDGVIGQLTLLKQFEIPTFVVTNGENRAAEISLNKTALISYFDGCIAAGDVQNHKPHPEPYLKAAKQVGHDIKDCLIVEDSLTGIEAGLKAGGYVVAIASSVDIAQLQHADLAVENFAQIPLQKLFSL